MDPQAFSWSACSKCLYLLKNSITRSSQLALWCLIWGWKSCSSWLLPLATSVILWSNSSTLFSFSSNCTMWLYSEKTNELYGKLRSGYSIFYFRIALEHKRKREGGWHLYLVGCSIIPEVGPLSEELWLQSFHLRKGVLPFGLTVWEKMGYTCFKSVTQYSLYMDSQELVHLMICCLLQDVLGCFFFFSLSHCNPSNYI